VVQGIMLTMHTSSGCKQSSIAAAHAAKAQQRGRSNASQTAYWFAVHGIMLTMHTSSGCKRQAHETAAA
jgi:hypothetical protein